MCTQFLRPQCQYINHVFISLLYLYNTTSKEQKDGQLKEYLQLLSAKHY